MPFTSQPLDPNKDTPPDQQSLAQTPLSSSLRSQIESPTPQIVAVATSFFKTYLTYIIGGALALFALLIGGIMLLSGGNFSQSGVVVSITGPEEVSSGAEVVYNLKYLNGTQQDIKNAVLSLTLPSDIFVVATNSLEEKSVLATNLGTITKGSEATQEVRVVFAGAQQDVKLFRVTLEYTPPGVETRLTQDAQLSAVIKDVPLGINVQKPSTISSGQDIEYKIHYRNQTSDVLFGNRLSLQIPDGFIVKDINPILASGQFIPLDGMQPAEERTITIHGRLVGAESQQKTIRLIYQKVSLQPDGTIDSWDIQRFEDKIVLNSLPISVSVLVNDSDNYTANLDDNLRYRIIVKNNSKVTFSNLRVALDLAGPMFDLSRVSSNGGLVDPNGHSINFNNTTSPALGVLQPGDSAELDLFTGVKQSLPLGRLTTNDDLLLTTRVESSSIPDTIPSDIFPIRIESRSHIAVGPVFSVAVVNSYNDWATLGSYPPVVGQETQFISRIRIATPTDSLSGAVVRAHLGPGVKWLDKTRISASQVQPIQYDARLNTLTWNIGAVPARNGSGAPGAEAAIMLSITPALNQSGQAPALLQDISIDAVNDRSRQAYHASVRTLTTERVEGSSIGGRVK